MRVLVACFGNVLRGDDGAGVAVAALLARDAPPGVRVLDVGIGGLHLVQELLDPVDALVVVDAVDLGRPEGSVVVVRPEIPDARGWTAAQRWDRLTDAHHATPERALLLARGLGVLPERTVLVGIQVSDAESWGTGLTGAAERSLAAAAAEVRRVVGDLGVPWP